MDEIKTPPRFLRRPWTGGRIKGRGMQVLLLLLALSMLALLVFGDSGWLRQLRLSRERGALRAEIRELHRQESLLSGELERLLQDPDYRERIAREEWGFKAPGERVYYLKRSSEPR